MNTRVKVAALALIAVSALGLTACSSGSSTPPASNAPAASSAPAASMAPSASSDGTQNENTEPSAEASAEGDNG
jgi:hypothetical protein